MTPPLVRIRSGEHLGDAKMSKEAPRFVKFNFLTNYDRRKWFSQTERRSPDLQNDAWDFYIFAPGLGYALSKSLVTILPRVKRSWSIIIINYERRIATVPGTPAGQPLAFATHWLLSCKQRSLPCHVGCMHLPNCHPRHRALPPWRAPLLSCHFGRGLVKWLPPRGKAL